MMNSKDSAENSKKSQKAFNLAVGSNLRRLRNLKGWNQEVVADVLGKKDYTAYGKIEQGYSSLSLEDAVKVAKLYDVSLDHILNPELPEAKSVTLKNGYAYEVPTGKNVVSMTVELNGSREELERQYQLLLHINSLLAGEKK